MDQMHKSKKWKFSNQKKNYKIIHKKPQADNAGL